jgi:formate hydrogenlyase transcriptional activator
MKILHLEDDPKDAELIQSTLEAEGISCDVTRVDTPAEFHGSLERSAFDLVLADYTLPAFDGISALRVKKEISPDVPFIFVSGTLGEEIAVEALKLGATDFVPKTRLSRMAPVVRRALRETEEQSRRQLAERTLRESEAYLAEAQRLSQTGSWAWNLETGDIRYWSEECFRVLGFDSTSPAPKFEEFLPRVHPEDRPFVKERFEKAVREKADFELDYRVVHPAAGVRDIHAVGHAVLAQSGELVEFVGTVIDITERKWAEQELKRSEAFLAEAQRVSQTGSFSWSVETDEITWSEELYRIFEFDKNLHVTLEQITSRVHPDDLPLLRDMLERMRHAAKDFEYEHRLLMPDQSVKHIHLFAHAARDKNGRLEYIGAAQDVTRRRVVEEQLRERELNLRRITQTIPGMLWSATPEGEVDYCNRPLLEFTAMTPEQAHGWGWTEAIYPEDRDSLIEGWRSCLASGTPHDMEARMRRFDGGYRWLLFRANPLRDESGKIVKWYGTTIDIEDRKRREETLRASELSWRQIIDNIPGFVATMGPMGEVEFLNRQILEYFGKTSENLKDWALTDAVHPDDLPRIIQARIKSIEEGRIYEVEHRCRRADGVYRWFQVRGLPVRDAENTITAWYLLLTDIDDRKRAEQRLRESEEDLRTITDTIRQPIIVLAPDGTTLYVNQVALDLTGFSKDQLDEKGFWARVVHPDDFNRLRAERQERLLSGVPFELEFRARFKNGEYRWQLMQYNPLKDESGQIIRWYSTATDIDDRKRSEDRLRQSEAELRTITDAIRQFIVVLAPDGNTLYANKVALEILRGLTDEDSLAHAGLAMPTDVPGELAWNPGWRMAAHPDDRDRIQAERQKRLLQGLPFELEGRMFTNGQHRWQLFQYNPLKGEDDQIIRWYVTATDIDDRKKSEERLHYENVKLAQERVYFEEQIRSEMGFEQIIGNSPALKHVLELIETVAPSDSTVLLLGETGTGKELIARAVHERSRRKAKTFVKLNCAAIPTGLLESELFGHEKGAFTGAIIQKVGRMELADQGTLFLDEVGDIPIDIQPKLLRALQEKEFERLGSTHTRKVNLRLVAATNRNLERMVADREFRSDLFYRLNVFPIRIPPLRDRKEDIPLLVAYFVQKFAKQMNKRIDSIPVATMKALTAWDWPGNIRELENFIERGVILTHGDALAAPLAELRRVTPDEPARDSESKGEDDITRIVKETIASLKNKTEPTERTMKQHDEIVRVLAECKGRVGGADGAAVRMGLSRTTLISRMKKLGINPYDYE